MSLGGVSHLAGHLAGGGSGVGGAAGGAAAMALAVAETVGLTAGAVVATCCWVAVGGVAGGVWLRSVTAGVHAGGNAIDSVASTKLIVTSCLIAAESIA